MVTRSENPSAPQDELIFETVVHDMHRAGDDRIVCQSSDWDKCSFHADRWERFGYRTSVRFKPDDDDIDD